MDSMIMLAASQLTVAVVVVSLSRFGMQMDSLDVASYK